MSGRHKEDAGFTLTELIVVIGLLGIVVGGAYALFYLARSGTEMSDRQAWTSREIGKPLEHMERMFSQRVSSLVSSDRYICEFRTDQDRDNLHEFHRFEATTDGRLVERVYEQPNTVTTARTAVWSSHNVNRASGTRLFTYYNIDNVDISAEPPLYIQQYAASVEIEIVTEYDGKRYSDSRRVYFRNR